MSDKGDARLVRYAPDKVNDFKPHSDGTASFSTFLLSEQLRKPLNRAAHDIVAIASYGPHEFDSSGDYAKHFDVDKTAILDFKPKVGKRHPRAMALVTNDSDHAAALEFGSGEANEGQSPDVARPQGGNNRAYRVLGKAAGKIGDWRNGE